MKKIAVIGLGYVGLPLALEFGKIREVVGFDINSERVNQLKEGRDVTNECTALQLRGSEKLSFSSEIEAIRSAEIFIVTVPTPIDTANRPDLQPLISACKTVGRFLKQGDLVVFESTVFPGATEDVCVPILEIS